MSAACLMSNGVRDPFRNEKPSGQINYAPPEPPKEPFLTTALGIVDCVLLFAGCVLWCGAGMVFDAPGSEMNPAHLGLCPELSCPSGCLHHRNVGSAGVHQKGESRDRSTHPLTTSIDRTDHRGHMGVY